MKLTKASLKYFLIAATLLTALNTKTYADGAGGFPVRPGSLLLSPSVNYFFANKGWDSLRNKTPFANGGEFRSISYSLYSEYGISKRFTAVAQLPFVTNNYKDLTGYNSSQAGFADLELGIRYYVLNIDYKYYLTIQGTFITPLYSNNPNLGYGQQGAEIRAAFAGSAKILGKNCYFTLENGIRQYFGNMGPIQDRYTVTFGVTLDRRFKHQLSASLGGFYSTSSLASGYDPKQVAANKNFAFNQMSLSYGYAITRKLSLFLSAGKFINGRNTGDGTSGSASFIIRPF